MLRNSENFKRAFTLIELLIAIAISIFIAAAIYWSIVTALQSWAYMRDELILQKATSKVMQELIEGAPDAYGLREALEVVKAYEDEIEVVFPWTDDTHMAQSGLNIYTLNSDIKPGTGIPIGEARPPDSDTYYSIPVSVLDWGKKEELNKVQIPVQVAPGSLLRFTYHPDYKKNSDALCRYRWIKEEGQIYLEDSSGTRPIAKNPFGVKITRFSFRYYDCANKKVTDNGDVNESDLQLVSGVEIFLEAAFSANKLLKTGDSLPKETKKELLSFVNLRNSPSKGGSINLKEGMRLAIPDSKNIRAFFITNLTGIDDGDILQLDASPDSGKDWKLTVAFSRSGISVPKVASYTIEYPSGETLFTDKPNTSIELGLNLLSLGPNGLYDYDKDEGIEDTVNLEGAVELKIVKMDIAGAGLFVR